MTRSLLKRRALLQQLGASAFLAAPVFRSVLAEAQATAPLRLVVFHFPSGVSMLDRGADYAVQGSTWSYDHVLASLKDIQSDILLFNNITMPTADVVTVLPELEGHGGGVRTMLTSNTNQAERSYGDATSIDQMLANAFGSRTKFGSLQLGVITNTNGTSFARRVVYNNGTYIEPVENAQATFARLFPGATVPTPPSPTMTPDPQATAELAALHATGKSRLDQLRAELTAIKAIAGVDEQSKLDLHLTGLRELENSLPVIGSTPGATFQGVTCAPPNIGNPPTPTGFVKLDNPVDYIQELGPVMQELMYQAINCDLTRFATFQWMSTGDNNIYPFLAVNQTHHTLEHGWREDDNMKGMYDRIQNWLMLQISTFIKRLKATPEGNGSMLDNTAVLVVSEMWGEHGHDELIALIAGKAGGAIRTGRTLDAGGRPHGDLLLSLVNIMGLNATTLGDPKYLTGPLNLG
ncbi:MAG: DUF1552 domain-containing protein [Polyangiaceae bacterium]|nr:DUF1552 domain-containing protein [Polyangiaceae bacterium]